MEALLAQAALENSMVQFEYWGGSTPGETRRVSPAVVFRVDGFDAMYMSGYCYERQAERTFRLDRLRNLRSAT